MDDTTMSFDPNHKARKHKTANDRKDAKMIIAGRGRPLSLMQSKTEWLRWPNPSCEISGLTTMISATTWRMNC